MSISASSSTLSSPGAATTATGVAQMNSMNTQHHNNSHNFYGGQQLGQPAPLSLPPTAIYDSEDSLFDAIQAHARVTGQCFVKLRSTTHNDRKTVTYACDRCKKPKVTRPGHEDTPGATRKRKETTNRTDCQFSFLGVQLKDGAGWEVRYRPAELYGEHNHPPSQSTAEHSGHRRLNQEALTKMRELQLNGVPRQQAIDILRKTCNPDLEAHNVLNAWSTVQNAPVADDGTVQRRPRQRRSDAKTPAPGQDIQQQCLSSQQSQPVVQTPRRGAGRPPKNSTHNQNRIGGQGRTSITSVPLTTLEYNEQMHTAGYSQKHTRIRVQNMQSTALVGSDLWGGKDHKGRSNRYQPIEVTCEVSLRNRFDEAAQNDRLDDGTVNYSTLSKTIFKVLKSRGADRNDPSSHLAGWPGIEIDWSLSDLLDWIFVYITGRRANGSVPDAASAHMYIRDGCPCLGGPMYERPLLSLESMQELEMTAKLPKGTLLSEGVSLTVASGYLPGQRTYHEAPYRATLKLENIRIPTLIGLNANERLAKQMVIATVEIDPYCVTEMDHYNELEQIVVKSLEESAFETLESLAIHLTSRITKHFIFPYHTRKPFPIVTISLTKPSATTFADAPIVTVSRSSDPEKDERSKQLWDEWISWNMGRDSMIPYPFHGKLDHWIQENFPGDYGAEVVGNGVGAGTMPRSNGNGVHQNGRVQVQQHPQQHPQQDMVMGGQQQLPQGLGQPGMVNGGRQMDIDMSGQHQVQVQQMNGQQINGQMAQQMQAPMQAPMQMGQVGNPQQLGGQPMQMGEPFGGLRS